jgi:hypothetical protein
VDKGIHELLSTGKTETMQAGFKSSQIAINFNEFAGRNKELVTCYSFC